MVKRRTKSLNLSNLFLAASVIGIAIGGALWFADARDAADAAWAVTTAVGVVPVAWEVLVWIVRR